MALIQGARVLGEQTALMPAAPTYLSQALDLCYHHPGLSPEVLDFWEVF